MHITPWRGRPRAGAAHPKEASLAMPRKRIDNRHPPGRGAQRRRSVIVTVYRRTEWGVALPLRRCYLGQAERLVARGDAAWCVVLDGLPTLLDAEPDTPLQGEADFGAILLEHLPGLELAADADELVWVLGVALAEELVRAAYRARFAAVCSYHTSGGATPAPIT